MSSSSLCQGFQSCLEPGLIEPRVLRLTLTPPGSNHSSPSASPYLQLPDSDSDSPNNETDIKVEKSPEKGGWSFLQDLADNTSNCDNGKESEAEEVYVHPMVKRSSSTLNAKSLEMCTEELGCETGSNASDYSEDTAFLPATSSFTGNTPEPKTSSVSKRLNRARTFPPALTSMTDVGGVQISPRRENGRLILTAETVPLHCSVFEAERSHGRLRLWLFNEFDCYCDDNVGDEEEREEQEEEGEFDAQVYNEEEYGEEDSETGDLEGNNGSVEGEMGMRNMGRPSSCKEGGSGNNGVKWEKEPCWVAT